MERAIECSGCLGYFVAWEVSEDGYCEVCQYEHEQKLDHMTGEDNE